MNQDPFKTLMFNLTIMGDTPGWQEIKDTVHTTPDEPALSAPSPQPPKFKFLRRSHKPEPEPESVSVEHLRAALSELGEHGTNLAKMAICNTVGFANHVLQAEALAHSRSSKLYLDESDRMDTGPHWTVKKRGLAEEISRDEARQKGELLNTNRQNLPFAEHSSMILNRQDTSFFYGYSELYGMARADFTPKRFRKWLLDPGIIGLPRRTEVFLQNNEQMMNRLTAVPGPVQQLEEAGVYVPEAMQIADSPTPGVLFSAALEVIKHTQA